MMLASLTNVVPTLASAFMTRLQVVSVPEHAPVQAANVEPDAAETVTVTGVLLTYLALQPVELGTPLVMVQLMAGLRPPWLLTVPLPAPLPPTVSE